MPLHMHLWEDPHVQLDIESLFPARCIRGAAAQMAKKSLFIGNGRNTQNHRSTGRQTETVAERGRGRERKIVPFADRTLGNECKLLPRHTTCTDHQYKFQYDQKHICHYERRKMLADRTIKGKRQQSEKINKIPTKTYTAQLKHINQLNGR